MSSARRPRVVIVGGGFGGLHAARALRGAAVDVTLIDRTNHHLFQPLLYQVATATLAPTDIATPIRWLLRKQRNVEVLMDEARAIDVQRHIVTVADGGEIGYDYLILAAGSRHSYFGHEDWERIAPGLKSIEDAIEIRCRFLTAFEEAEKTDDPAERDAWLTFVVVGGGPTGVELAGMLPTVARHTLAGDFRRIDAATARVILLDAGPRLLATFSAELGAHAQRDLEALGVDVRLNSPVTEVEPHGVEVAGEHIVAKTVLWAAGNAAAPLGRALGAPVDRAGRLKVEPELSIPGHPEIFAIGDMAEMFSDGKEVPGVAPAAMQSGAHAARNILRTVQNEARQPFRYRNKGDLATIGRYKAVAAFGDTRVTGRLAWWLWLFVHILYLAGFRNRLSVLVQWGYAFFTYQRGARLITGQQSSGETAAGHLRRERTRG